MSSPARVSNATKTAFLGMLQQTGVASYACRRLGVNRSTAYQWREDPAFDAAWRDALRIRRDQIADEVVEKAMATTGRIVEEAALDFYGRPLLDEDFEPVILRRLVDYDGNVLRSLIGRFVQSEEPAPGVPDLPPRPRLVAPEPEGAP